MAVRGRSDQALADRRAPVEAVILVLAAVSSKKMKRCEFRRKPAGDYRFEAGQGSDLMPATIPR